METVQELRKIDPLLDYSSDQERIKRFLLFYQEQEQYKYLNILKNIKDSVDLDLNDLAIYDESGLAKRFEKNSYSYIQLCHRAIDDILFNDQEYSIENTDDVFLFQRISRFKEINPEKKITEAFPGQLLRNYTVNLIPRHTQIKSVRDVKAEDIGSLVRVRGIVTRVTQVKPSVRVATYICESCGTEIYQTVSNDTFDQLEECFSEKCRTRKIRGTLCLVTRGSKFVKFQALQLQELTSDVPHGSIPRILNVECFSTLTERVKPGEFVVLSGIFLPKPYYGFKKLRAGLLNDIYLHCSHIESSSCVKSPISLYMTMDNLISAFAPEIFGMREIKKILLLMLVGSTSIQKEDGLKIRGNINVLLIGDPGIAKSQLLKTVVKISKRGVYTTGKGSSGVGLTASVSKDPVTNEVVLEGGALVISDNGICCIDELDKMNENDRVSIHEVMEQQTVSISKAGINTTLNARCGVLGAANPIKGRYDPKKTVEQNIGMPVSLVSRFDVLCILKDDSNSDKDLEMANHITSLHFEEQEIVHDYSHLKAFIEKAKAINPAVSPMLKDKLTNAYLNARKDKNITPRYLLSLIRIAIAHARLRLSDAVTEEDVNESINILESMKVPTAQPKQSVSLKHTIYNFIISLAKESEGSRVVNLNELFAASSFDPNKVEDVISEFEASGIWLRNNEEIVIFN